MVENVYEPEAEGLIEEEPKPMRLQARSTDLFNFYQISIEELISKAKDRYDLVMKVAKLAREINVARLRYGVPRPEKSTVVALNEILQEKSLEARNPDELFDPAEERAE
ncbi:MAG TPA: DNA-directed RNA polymerase subunit omega [bacterium]|nr:DNA-directed RNA polymerase subunit omega [bacterium]